MNAMEKIEVAVESMPPLEGTERQMHWATNLRLEFVNALYRRIEGTSQRAALTASGILSVPEMGSEEAIDVRAPLASPEAVFWIDMRGHIPRLTTVTVGGQAVPAEVGCGAGIYKIVSHYVDRYMAMDAIAFDHLEDNEPTAADL
jgi:hypothetical protein